MDNEIIIESPEYTKAKKLTMEIRANAEIMQESLFQICTKLKEVKEGKLYKALGYENFSNYCEDAIGFTIQQSRKYIAIADAFDSEKGKSTFPFEKIGTEKLYLLAKLDEPQREEIVQNVDLNNTSVKKLKEEIASLKSEISLKDDDIRNLETNYENLEKRHIELGHENMKLSATLRESQDTQKNLVGQIERLEDTVQELESRPVEVAVADNSEEIQKLRDDNLREMFRMGKAHSDEIRKIKADYEQRISEMQENQADKSDVRAEINAYQKVAEDSLHNLYAAICRQNEYGYGRLKTSVVEMLKEWAERFDELADYDD